MLVQKVKVTAVGDPVAYQKKENNTPLKTPDGQDVVGYRRQVLFESRDYKKDSIPVTVFSDTRPSVPLRSSRVEEGGGRDTSLFRVPIDQLHTFLR